MLTRNGFAHCVMSVMILLLYWGSHTSRLHSSCRSAFVSGFSAYSFMSDLPTPSLLLDMQALQRRVDAFTGVKQSAIPPILLPSSQVLIPIAQATTRSTSSTSSPNDHPPHSFDPESVPLALLHTSASINVGTHDPVCYLNARVIAARSNTGSSRDAAAADDKDETEALATTFLAQLDLPTNCPPAQLVLGLNNHHCVSYYWARSAGAGAAMEAPGVLFQHGHLRWQSVDGPVVSCNSNDGKRSEWVNFLQPGDMVQLLLLHCDDNDDDDDEAVAASVLKFVQVVGRDDQCIFGVSTKGRPLGSEPVVVCEWKVRQYNAIRR